MVYGDNCDAGFFKKYNIQSDTLFGFSDPSLSIAYTSIPLIKFPLYDQDVVQA